MLETKQEPKRSWSALLVEALLRNAKEVVGGALVVAETLENDVRLFVVRFVRDMVLSVALLFVGIGFLVFGVGMVLVETLQLGPATGPIVVGVFFITSGALVFAFSHR